MANRILKQLFTNPLELLKTGFYKYCIGPFQYGKKGDYDAARYWDDRFKKHGATFKAVGIESLSPEENEKLYKESEKIVRHVLDKQHLDMRSSDVLDIGCGTGFYTNVIHQLHCPHLTGMDITDAFFGRLRNAYPQYEFIKRDISEQPVGRMFDLILCIDVILHIVNEEKMKKTIGHLTDALKSNGILLIAPLDAPSKERLFYLRQWTTGEILSFNPSLKVEESVPFRSGNLCVMRKST